LADIHGPLSSERIGPCLGLGERTRRAVPTLTAPLRIVESGRGLYRHDRQSRGGGADHDQADQNLTLVPTRNVVGAPGARNVECLSGKSPLTGGRGRATNAPVDVKAAGPSCAAVLYRRSKRLLIPPVISRRDATR